MFDFKIRKTYFIIIFVAIEVVAALYWNQDFKQKLELYYEEKLDEQNMAYTVTLNTYKMIADVYFGQIIKQKELIHLLAAADTTDEIQKSEARVQLGKLYKSTFVDMNNQGLKQFSIYLPNSEVLFRFHQPILFGDDKGGGHFSVQKTIADQRAYSGFEEASDFNGFRFTYPIFSPTRKLLGVIDIAVGFNKIREHVMKAKKQNYAFIIRKDAIGTTQYKFSNTHYITSDIHSQYLYDTHIYEVGKRIYADKVDFKIKSKLNDILSNVVYSKLSKTQPFAKTLPVKGSFYTTTLLPIKNIEGKRSAYLIGYSFDTSFKILETDLFLRVVGSSLLALVILGLVYFENRRVRLIRLKNEEMQYTSTELRKLNNTKEKFLSYVADDLKNPFYFLKGYSKALLEDLEDLPREKVYYYLMLINEASENGSHLIDNLLEWSRIQKSKNFFKPDFHYASNIIDSVVQEYIPVAQVKKISLYSEVVKKETNSIFVDQDNIRSLLKNLISNAVKFTPGGGIVTISAKNTPHFLEIIIEDNGIGMKSQIVKTLFSTNKDQNSDSLEESSHLGLILSREIVERNGGTLRVESKLGKGSKFTCSLPIDKPNKLFKVSSKRKKIRLNNREKLTEI